jgi:hypothetical protein
MGDFYEMFFEDAHIGSKELEIALTSRDKGQKDSVPLCGVPYFAAETYINKLLQKGYKVALCDQVEDPKLAKGIVKRDVVRVFTPGLATDSIQQGPVDDPGKEPMEELQIERNPFLLRLSINDRSPYPFTQGKESPFDKTCICDLHSDLRGQIFPESRRGDDNSRSNFAKILCLGFQRFGEIHGHPR